MPTKFRKTRRGAKRVFPYFKNTCFIVIQSLPFHEDKVKLRNFSSGLNIIHINDKLYGGSDHRREGLVIGK